MERIKLSDRSLLQYEKLGLSFRRESDSMDVRLRVVDSSVGFRTFFDSVSFRLLRDAAKIIQENHYYPFGQNMVGIEELDRQSLSSQEEQKFQYNAKEKLDEFGLFWNDHGARNLDLQTGRWTAIDPLAEKYTPFSPYVAMGNNPVSLFDPDGKEATKAPDGNPIKRLILVATETGSNNRRLRGDVILYSIKPYLQSTDAEGKSTYTPIKMKKSIVMFEKRSAQEDRPKLGSKNPRHNAFKDGMTYKMTPIDYFSELAASNDENNPKESYSFDKVTAKGAIGHPSIGSNWLIGCKSFCFTKDIKFDDEGNLIPGGIGANSRELSNAAFGAIQSLLESTGSKELLLNVNFNNHVSAKEPPAGTSKRSGWGWPPPPKAK